MRDDRPIGASYARISGPTDDRTASLESQEEASIEKLTAEGYQVPPEYRLREQFSGYESIYERTVLIRLRQMIVDGKVKAICCYDTDRLARDSQQLTGLVANTEKAGCKVFFAKLDHQSGRIGDLILYLRGYASSVEYDQIRDRTMRGCSKILSSGQLLGNGPTRYGYRFIKASRSLEADAETSAVVMTIFTLASEGKSPRWIARYLTDRGTLPPSAHRNQRYKAGATLHWSEITIREMLRDRIYIGEASAKKSKSIGRGKNGRTKVRKLPSSEWIAMPHGKAPAIVPTDLFERANATLDSRVPRYTGASARTKNNTHVLAGHVFCAACGVRMTTAKQRRAPDPVTGAERPVIAYYRCTASYPNRRSPVACSESLISGSQLDSDAWRAVQRIISDPSVIAAELRRMKEGRVESQITSDLTSAETRRARGQKRLSNLVDALAEADSKPARDAMRDKLRTIEAEIKAADEEIRDLKSRLIPFARFEESCADFLARVQEIRTGLVDADNLSLDEKRDIMKWLGVKVLARKDAPPSITVVFATSPVANTQSNPLTTSHVCSQGITLEFAAIA